MTNGSGLNELDAGANPDGLNDDFLYHFYKGGELLAKDRLGEAQEQLEKAAQIRPDNPRCLNLLGLLYFKRGFYDESIAVYQDLVGRYPKDPTLRANLAMVYLKADRLDEAESELFLALQLDPNHAKTFRTLAVVLVKKGEIDRARQFQEKAGIPDMDRFVASLQSGYEEIQPEQATLAAEHAKTQPPVPPETIFEVPPQIPLESPFRIEATGLGILIGGQVHSRLEGLVWMEGDLSFHSVRKRFGGQETRYSFDKGERAMLRVEGKGSLHFPGRERGEEGAGFHLVQIRAESAFFLEPYVFAFTGVDAWENGRLPVHPEQNLSIFHLQGPAQVVLCCPGAIGSRRIVSGERFLLDVERLAGWSGNLVPKVAKLVRPLPEGYWIELNGSGEVFYLANPPDGVVPCADH